jgi:hypothetical protein
MIAAERQAQVRPLDAAEPSRRAVRNSSAPAWRTAPASPSSSGCGAVVQPNLLELDPADRA